MRRWLTETLEMEKALTKKPKVEMSSKMKTMALAEANVDALVAYLKTLK